MNYTNPKIVTREEWLKQRIDLLAAEKDFTKKRDALSKRRRELPWVKIDKDYVFDGPSGCQSLEDLFDGRSQLIVYHFMFAPDWENPCKSCSFWADHFDGAVPHLNARDVSFVAVSRAPRSKLKAFAERMGWKFKWLSSQDSSFNFDFDVSFEPKAMADGTTVYNYAKTKVPLSELQGVSVFARGPEGAVYHTYSCFGRGQDLINGAYNFLDLTPKGRDEDSLPFTMAWVRYHDEYETAKA